MSSAQKTILVTGGAGFIGSSFVRLALAQKYRVGVLDSLTYAGRMENLAEIQKQIQFFKLDLRDHSAVSDLIRTFKPDGIIHFAAESHVDNSIKGPRVFLETNIFGTFHLLESVREHLPLLPQDFRMVHVSTDEVFGELGSTGKFTEHSPYEPSSPYSASKAASDHLVRAWHRTYQLPMIVTNCSNNYGPRQFPEKLIPRMILNCLHEQALPVYGKGLNVRDWIHVEDHAHGVLLAFEKGKIGESYCFGGNSERQNLQVVQQICQILDELKPRGKGSYRDLIQFVEDRKGHDFRYAIDDSKALRELQYERQHRTFEDGLLATVKWYLQNLEWIKAIQVPHEIASSQSASRSKV